MRISDWSADVCSSDLIIRSRVRKTIEQELADDPYAQLFFSDLLKRAIAEASALFDHPYKQYILFKDLEEKLAAKSVGDLPKRLDGHRHARAYFGIIRLEMGGARSEEHTSELQSLMRTSYAVYCLKKTKITLTPRQKKNYKE